MYGCKLAGGRDACLPALSTPLDVVDLADKAFDGLCCLRGLTSRAAGSHTTHLKDARLHISAGMQRDKEAVPACPIHV